ncbi:MAG: radical SAM protein, partial [Acidobacteria bacterium]|nr:radical SAM protein [Acidobacteriota bacterium]
MKVSLIQLGCPKNIVDGEWALGRILSKGNILTDYNDADVVLINTCGFIESAKEESVEAILNCIEDKKKGKIKKIIVFGCLSERYKEELEKEFPEVDAFFPLSALSKAEEMLFQSPKKFEKGFLPVPDYYENRFRITPPHYAYVKIGDGCSHKCSFCAIPSIRGKSVSRSRKGIVKELETLAEEGVKEAILVSQDTTSYGREIGESIVNLLKDIETSATPKWIRLLYLYPTAITDEFISVISDSEKILHYFDIPFQHASQKVLKAMGRGGSISSYLR